MILLPAIDLYEGCAVRLLRGDYTRKTVYSAHPLEVALDFARAGAQWVHVVDLEGAQVGDMPNFGVITQILRESGLLVEVGGGIRTPEAVDKALGAGAARVILGTAALKSPRFLEEMTRAYGDKIAVGVDVREGMVAINGWTKTSRVPCAEFMRRLTDVGVKTAVVTDIARDGALRGANRALYALLAEAYPIHLIASGGVSDLADISALKALGLYGAIVGKAYYTGAIDLKEAVSAAL